MNHIDHIAVNETQRRSMLDVRSLRGADIGLTYHNIFIAKFTVRLLKVDEIKALNLLNSAKFKNEQEKTDFTSHPEEKFQALCDSDYNTNPIETK